MAYYIRFVRVLIWGIIFFTICWLAWGENTAMANPGDEWIFGSDSPVAVDRAYSQHQPVVSGDYIFWEDNRPGATSQTFTRIYYQDRSDPDGLELPLIVGTEYFENYLPDTSLISHSATTQIHTADAYVLD